MKITRILLIGFFLIGSLSSFEALAHQEPFVRQDKTIMAGDLTYNWTTALGAISYTVDIEHENTFQKYSQETANTTVTFVGIPTGSYEVRVTAQRADGSTFIVIEDQTEL